MFLMTHTITIRSRRGILGTVVVAVLALVFEVVVLLDDGWRVAALSLPWPLLVTAFTAWLWIWPRLTLAPGGVVARNHFRTILIPWADLTDARSDLGLYVSVGSHRYFCAAPPARGGFRIGRARSHPPTAPVIDDAIRVHHVIDVEPVIAAQLLSEELGLQRHPDRRDPVSTAARERIARNLAEDPIPDVLGSSGFPSSTSIRWMPWPAVGIIVLLAAAIVSTMAL
jgi:hypothetical protein